MYISPIFHAWSHKNRFEKFCSLMIVIIPYLIHKNVKLKTNLLSKIVSFLSFKLLNLSDVYKNICKKHAITKIPSVIKS